MSGKKNLKTEKAFSPIGYYNNFTDLCQFEKFLENYLTYA